MQFRGESGEVHLGICDVVGEPPFCDVVLLHDFEHPAKPEKIMLKASLIINLFRLGVDPGVVPRRLTDLMIKLGHVRRSDDDGTRPPASFSTGE